MREHFKGVVWPRGTTGATVKNDGKKVKQNVYRYVVVGLIVTDQPIAGLEGKNEVFLDGPVLGTVGIPLSLVKSRRPNHKLGDATDVLCGLGDL